MTKKRRQAIKERDGCICGLCGLPIWPDEPYDIDHEIAREMGGSDDDSNLRAVHVPCHRLKSKQDVKLISKSNRIRRENGPKELRRKRKPIPKPAKTVWPSRPFPRRVKA